MEVVVVVNGGDSLETTSRLFLTKLLFTPIENASLVVNQKAADGTNRRP